MGQTQAALNIGVCEPLCVPHSRGHTFVILKMSINGRSYEERIVSFPSAKQMPSPLSLGLKTFLEVQVVIADSEAAFLNDQFDHFSSVFIPMDLLSYDSKFIALWLGLDECKRVPESPEECASRLSASKRLAGYQRFPKVAITLQLVDDTETGLACGVQSSGSSSFRDTVVHFNDTFASLHRDEEMTSSQILEREVATLRAAMAGQKKQYETEINYLVSMVRGGVDSSPISSARSGLDTERRCERLQKQVQELQADSELYRPEKIQLLQKISELKSEVEMANKAKEEALKMFNIKVSELRWLQLRIGTVERERDILRSEVCSPRHTSEALSHARKSWASEKNSAEYLLNASDGFSQRISPTES